MIRTLLTMAKEALLLLYLWAAILLLFVVLGGCVAVTCDSHSEDMGLSPETLCNQERD